jgi:hypothetical protein
MRRIFTWNIVSSIISIFTIIIPSSTASSLKVSFKEQDLQQMVNDLRNMGLIHLMEFRKD